MNTQLSSTAELSEFCQEVIGSWALRFVKTLANTWQGTLLTLGNDSQDITAPLVLQPLARDIAGLLAQCAYSISDKRPLDPEIRDQLARAYEQYADFSREFLAQTSPDLP